MAYADPLDPNTPADNSFAGQGDDEIRKKTRAIRERLGTIFADLDADPLAFIAKIITEAALADNAVIARVIADDAIIERHYADNSIPRTAFQDNTVGEVELIDEGVTAAKIKLKTITPAQLQDDIDLSTKLADESIPYAKLDPPLAITGTLEVVSALDGSPSAETESWEIYNGCVSNNATTTDSVVIWNMPISYRAGEHIRRIRARFYRGHAAALITARLLRVQDGVVVEQQALAIPAGIGWWWADSAAFDHVFVADNSYHIEVVLTAGGGDVHSALLQHVEVTRDRVTL